LSAEGTAQRYCTCASPLAAGPWPTGGPGFSIDGALVALLDVAGTKAKALLDRIERKDYQDILELLNAGLSMSQIAGAAEAIFPAQVSSIMVLRALSHYGDGAARSLPDTWKERLIKRQRGCVRPRPFGCSTPVSRCHRLPPGAESPGRSRPARPQARRD
jgi:hypothetical protein